MSALLLFTGVIGSQFVGKVLRRSHIVGSGKASPVAIVHSSFSRQLLVGSNSVCRSVGLISTSKDEGGQLLVDS